MATLIHRSPSPLREAPTTGFETLDNEYRLEEETWSWYDAKEYYPVKIGEVFKEGKDQVVGKLGFGSASTVWLCRDLVEHEYVTLKVFATGNPQAANEKNVLEYLDTVKSDHGGAKLIRRLRDCFELPGEVGPHLCLVHNALGVTLKELRLCSDGEKVAPILVQPIIYHVLVGLDYLHSEAKIVHTDVQEENFMMSIGDKEMLREFENEEWSGPSLRRIDHFNNRIIYTSRGLEIPDELTDIVVCDFGTAVFGEKEYSGEAMPDLYRAPELVLRTPWNEKIDIWSLGLMCWTLLEGSHLFKDRRPSRNDSTPAHIARMVALLGPPPKDLLERGSWSDYFFDESGTFKDDVETIPASLEDEIKSLDGEEKTLFLKFLRRILQWRPEDRPSASELIKDPWIQSILASDDAP